MLLVGGIDSCQNFGDRDHGLAGDIAVDVELGKDFGQIGVLAENAVIAACFATGDAWTQNLNLDYYPEFSDLVMPVRSELSRASVLEEVKILGGRKKGKRAELDVDGKMIDRSSDPPYVERDKGKVFLELTAEGWRLRGSRLEQINE